MSIKKTRTFPGNTPKANLEKEKAQRLQNGAKSCEITKQNDGTYLMTTVWDDGEE